MSVIRSTVIATVIFIPCILLPVIGRASPDENSHEPLKIIIDPGHGGKSFGAISPSGVLEKDIVLSLGKQLALKLSEEGFQVIMTRDSDVFIPLTERTALAKKAKADLFVSIHANANDDKSMHGVETYFLNLTADASSLPCPSDRVAERENAENPGYPSDIKFIIDELRLNSRINESSRFAASIQKSIISTLEEAKCGCKDNGVKQAFFHVLEGAEMPSVLIETGFITNPAECKLLEEKDYQANIVKGILAGIKDYFSSMGTAHSGEKPRYQNL